MQTSRDGVFDESHPFYLYLTTNASPRSLVDPLSFMLFPDAPLASLSIPRSTLSSPVFSSESLPVVPDYTVEPQVTQIYNRHRACLSEAPTSLNELSSDAPSSSFSEDVPSSPPVEPSYLIDSSLEKFVRHSQRLRRPPDYYSPSAFTTTALSDPASYRNAILHPEWQQVMAEEIAALEGTGMWDLVPYPPCAHRISCKCVYKVRTRSDGSLERYKARLIARGFQQEQG
jgi:hypothetical protein